jgi:hypothetical protein
MRTQNVRRVDGVFGSQSRSSERVPAAPLSGWGSDRLNLSAVQPPIRQSLGHRLIKNGDFEVCVDCGGNSTDPCDPDRPRCESCRQHPASIRETIGNVVFLVCGSCRMGGKAEYPVCPWCQGAIKPNDDTARAHGLLFHAGCLEELEMEQRYG